MFGQSIKNEEHIREPILILGLIFFLIVRDIFGISINKFIITGFITVMMINASIPSIIAMLSFCFPLFCGLPGKYIIVIAFVLLLWKGKFSINIHQIVCFFFIVLMEFIASIWYQSPDWLEIIGYMLFAMLLYWMLWTEEALDHKQCLKYYLLGDAVLCCIIIAAGIKTAPSNWIRFFSAGSFRFGDTQIDEVGNGMSLFLNPNGLAYYSLTGIAISFVLLEDQYDRQKIMYAGMLVICAIAGFLTQSRSWFLCVIILFAIYTVGKMSSLKRSVYHIICISILAYGAFLYFSEHPELLQGLITRFTGADMISADGRTSLFQQYMDAFTNNQRFQIMGTGVMQYRFITGVKQNSMHNSTQQLLVCYGVPGCIFVLYHLFAPIRRVTRRCRLNIIYWLPLLSVVIFTQTIQFIQPYIYMPPFGISAFALIVGRETSKTQYGSGISTIVEEERIK